MLSAIIVKELLLVRRDIHALLVLFLMPMAFIFIMSLSLQDTFQKDEPAKPKIGIVFDTPQDKEKKLGKSLTSLPGFQVVNYENNLDLKTISRRDQLTAIIFIPHQFINTLTKDKPLKPEQRLSLYYAPTSPESLRKLILSAVSQKLAAYQLEKILLLRIPDPEKRKTQAEKFIGTGLITENELYSSKNTQPNSVEQTVPAWLIFSMFFVVIPISTTFLIEKQHGTLQRLKTLPVPNSYFLIGKLIPYLAINMIQTVLMFLVGIYLLPIVGGQGLHLGSNAWLLVPMSVSVSLAAISFALFIATLVKTTEQATTIGGVSNLIFAAIGGIMVPTFVMPEFMQTLAGLSPMNWALEGYLTILLRQGDLIAISSDVLKLLVFASVFFIMAIASYRRSSII